MIVKIFGAEWCPFCVSTKNWLEKQGVEFEYVDVDQPGKRDEMKKVVPDNETIPVVQIGDKGYVNPSKDFLTKELKIDVDKTIQEHDLLLIPNRFQMIVTYLSTVQILVVFVYIV